MTAQKKERVRPEGVPLGQTEDSLTPAMKALNKPRFDIRKVYGDGEMASRHGVRMDENDPALNKIALNRLMLEQSAAQIIERIRDSIKEFEAAVAKAKPGPANS